MKAFKIFSMAAVAFMMVACSSEDEALDNTPVAGRKVHFTATIAAPGSDASTRTTYTEVTSGTDAGKIKVAWEQGDEIALIHNGTKDVVTVQTLNADGSATISGDITVGTDGEAVTIVYPAASVDAPTSGAEPVDNATYAAKWNSQDGTLTYIQDYLDFCRATSTLKVSGTNATLNDNIALKSNIAIVKFSLSDGTNDIAATQFVIKDGSDNVLTTVTPFPASSELYVAMAPATASTFRFEATTSTSFYTYAKLSATLAAGTYYHSPLALTITRMQHNPLWWVAQYNMAEGGSSFVTSHSTESQYCFDWAGACAEDVANYHLPTIDELESIFPCDGKTTNIFSLSETLASPKEFSEIACTVGGNSVSANTSVIGKNADADYYAVRFIGTQYASAWHYKWVTSPCNGLLIESYLIFGGCADVAAAKTILAGLVSSTIFTGLANSSSANQTPETTTMTAKAFTQRFLPACGAKVYISASIGGGGNGTADKYQGNNGFYWSASKDGSNFSYHLWIKNSVLEKISHHIQNGYSVRLFRDN